MPYTNYNVRNSRRPKKSKRAFVRPLIIAALVLLAGGVIWRFTNRNDVPKTEVSVNQDTRSDAPAVTEVAQPSLPDMQPLVDSWVANHPGTYAITITDEQGNKLGVTNGDQQFFTASIYKLYVAYIGYQKIDDGTYSLSSPYLNGWTRGKCLDEMIRSSDSPCAEKLWNELGKDTVTAKMKAYGLTNTSLSGLYTSSNDAAIILSRLQRGLDLKPASNTAMLASMKGQIYRDGLPAGFTKSEIYDKVGFRGAVEYHDTAIVKVNGKTVIVSVMTESAGSKNIAGLGAAIEKALQ